ncbi:hypothetical protein G7Y89_g7227 [Cudoniella acicularis]|uniref:Alpha-glucosidase n=1 Tax=Cudoniella acicularis TaxID=354080 RepID=A0A8H4RLA9_9HELO|nr:hypothetical protein G7Y89_g7227 [Cudoniella acicularis]
MLEVFHNPAFSNGPCQEAEPLPWIVMPRVDHHEMHELTSPTLHCLTLASERTFGPSVFIPTIATLSRRQTSRESYLGYALSGVSETSAGFNANLALAEAACNIYGNDIQDLKLTVDYDTESRLHIKIEDAAKVAYQVPASVSPTPSSNSSVSAASSALEFSYETSPFSFKVIRKLNSEVLFNTPAASLIFKDQYLRLRISLPDDPNIYGLGEHTDSLRLNTTDYTRIMWSRTHGVFLLSSSGMYIKVNRTDGDGQYLEYNLMLGVLDLYFLDGASPTEVAQQYSEVTGKAAMMPYWGFGLHQCRYGYRDFYSIAEVVYSYSAAGIPLETMWTVIDYMLVMTTDPDRFPIARVQKYVDYLHEHNQHYIVMADPALAYQTERVTAFPDWFHPDTHDFWVDEFAQFFDADTGVDIDALWIDMNEAANFNSFEDNPRESAEERGFPPTRPALRSAPRPIPGFPAAFQPNASSPYPPNDLAYAPPWLAPAAAPNTKRSSAPSLPLEKCQAREIIGFQTATCLIHPTKLTTRT